MQGFAKNMAAINAARAQMKAEGLTGKYSDHFKIEKHDGQFYVLRHSVDLRSAPANEPEDIEPQASAPEAAEPASTEPEAILKAQEQPESLAALQQAADALANVQQTATVTPNGKEWIRASSVAKPTKFVWHVADEMNERAIAAGQPAPTRKQVQDECIRRGVASGTARTQYQAWKKANDEARANQQRANELSARFNHKST